MLGRTPVGSLHNKHWALSLHIRHGVRPTCHVHDSTVTRSGALKGEVVVDVFIKHQAMNKWRYRSMYT
jgi:hypothetical protein